MKKLVKVSRWITIHYKDITPKHSLYCYSDNYAKQGEKACVAYFRWNNREYAIDQFINRFGMYGFDLNCEKYPAFICGYDGEGNIFNPLLCELDEYGEKIRLWIEE